MFAHKGAEQKLCERKPGTASAVPGKREEKKAKP